MPCLALSASAASVVRTPSATIFVPARISLSDWPLREGEADSPIAAEISGTREDEIAESGQSGKRVALGAKRHREPRQFGKAASNQRGQRVVTESKAFDDTGGNRNDVLERAAEFHADDIAAPVEP